MHECYIIEEKLLLIYDFSLLLDQILHNEYLSFTNPKMKEILKKKIAKFSDKKGTSRNVKQVGSITFYEVIAMTKPTLENRRIRCICGGGGRLRRNIWHDSRAPMQSTPLLSVSKLPPCGLFCRC
jgi:hypothetical protein